MNGAITSARDRLATAIQSRDYFADQHAKAEAKVTALAQEVTDQEALLAEYAAELDK